MFKLNETIDKLLITMKTRARHSLIQAYKANLFLTNRHLNLLCPSNMDFLYLEELDRLTNNATWPITHNGAQEPDWLDV